MTAATLINITNTKQNKNKIAHKTQQVHKQNKHNTNTHHKHNRHTHKHTQTHTQHNTKTLQNTITTQTETKVIQSPKHKQQIRTITTNTHTDHTN